MRDKMKNMKGKNRKLALLLTAVVLVVAMLVGTLAVAAGEWKQDSTGWWYEHDDGSYTKSNFEQIDGDWYYFNGSGYMVTGWQQHGSYWYYLNTGSGNPPKGAMLTGWQQISGSWYYLNPTSGGTPPQGAMLTGWQTISGKRYYLNPNGGAMLTGWQTISGSDYYLDPDDGGAMAVSKWVGSYWVDSAGKKVKNAWVDNHKYYVGADGVYLTSQWVGDYYVGADGKMATNAWVDNDQYYVGADGKYVTNQWAGDYYLGSDGKMVKSAWVEWKNQWYYVGADGACYKNAWKTIKGVEYYFNDIGVMVTNNWVDGYFLDENGLKTPANTWIKWKDGDYYIGSNGKYVTGFRSIVSTTDGQSRVYYFSEIETSKYYKGQMAYGDWHEIQGNWHYIHEDGAVAGGKNRIGDYEFYFDAAHNGIMLTGWIQDGDVWYYANPLSGQPGHNGDIPGGGLYTGRHVIDGTTYYFDTDGVWLETNAHRYLNPYYEYTEGGLYGSKEHPIETRTFATSTYSANVNGEIPDEYMALNIGAKVADSIDVHIPNSVLVSSREGTGWMESVNWAWSETGNRAADVSEANRDKIVDGGIYVIYRNVATIDNKKIDLKVSVVDYALLPANGETPILAFPTIYGKPGILDLNVAWVQLKYELMYRDGSLIPSSTKGVTTYYDVDHRQVICFNDDTNVGVYTRHRTAAKDQCQLKAGTVSGHGILDGRCVFWDTDEQFVEDDYHKYRQGFTETFQGNTLIRTFSFQHLATYGNGGIYHDGQVIENGNLAISKTVQSENKKNDIFNFDIVLKKNNAVVDLDATFVTALNAGGTTSAGEATFTDGRATVQLADGQILTLIGIPTGLSYDVAERTSDNYVTVSSGTTGKIVTDTTKNTSFTNTEKPDLIIQKVVTGNPSSTDKSFRFTAVIQEPGKAAVTHEFTLKDGQDPKVFANLLAGTKYTITESSYTAEGYTTTNSVSNTGNTTGEQTLTKDKTVTFTNAMDYLTLNLSKTVTGNGGDKTKAFEFEVKLIHEGEVFKSETVSLKHGEKVSYAVPFGTTYEIKEKITVLSGYNTSIAGADQADGVTATGTVNTRTAVENITYTNNKVFNVPTGIDDDVNGTMLLMLAITAQLLVAVILFYYSKKHRDRFSR